MDKRTAELILAAYGDLDAQLIAADWCEAHDDPAVRALGGRLRAEPVTPDDLRVARHFLYDAAAAADLLVCVDLLAESDDQQRLFVVEFLATLVGEACGNLGLSWRHSRTWMALVAAAPALIRALGDDNPAVLYHVMLALEDLDLRGAASAVDPIGLV